MANFEIPDKDLLTDVDRSADSFLLYDNSASKLLRTNIDSALDITSHPVGIDDIQTMTNKTLTSPNIASPVLSGTATGTYTLGGTPTFPSTVVTTTGTQTLTNKTLTSPSINNATIANPTLTVDTISEYTTDNGVNVDGVILKDSSLYIDAINEKTLANGVTVDGLNIKDGKLNTNDSVVTNNITNGAVTAAKTNFGGNYTTSEVDTGFTWVDGKTIYKKTVSFGSLPDTTTKSVAHGITDLGYVIKYEVWAHRTSDSTRRVLPHINVSNITTQFAIGDITNTNFSIISGTNLSTYNICYFTLYYTKA